MALPRSDFEYKQNISFREPHLPVIFLCLCGLWWVTSVISQWYPRLIPTLHSLHLSTFQLAVSDLLGKTISHLIICYANFFTIDHNISHTHIYICIFNSSQFWSILGPNVQRCSTPGRWSMGQRIAGTLGCRWTNHWTTKLDKQWEFCEPKRESIGHVMDSMDLWYLAKSSDEWLVKEVFH